MIGVELADPESAEAQGLLACLSLALERITGSSGVASFDVSDVKVRRGCFVVARTSEGQAVGCGALRPLDLETVELKRMYAAPGTAGVGRAVLYFLEDKAREFGFRQVWLETRRVNERAVAFYRNNGYGEIPNFGRYVGRPEAVCFGKRLLIGE